MTQPADVGRRPLVAPVLPGQLPAGQRTPGGDREVVVQRHRQQLTLDAAFEQVVLQLQLRLGGTVVADSTRPRMLLESGLLVRYYLPREGCPDRSPRAQLYDDPLPLQGHRALLVAAGGWAPRPGRRLDLPGTLPRCRSGVRADVLVDDLVDLEVANDGHPD